MNVIDTLSEGFAAANKRPWILAIPISADLFLWLGPKLTVGPLVVDAASAALPQQYGGLSNGMQQALESLNLFSMLAVYLPSLVLRLDSLSPLANVAPVSLVNSPLQCLLAAALVTLGGLWLGCWYLGFIAQLVRDGSTDVRQLTRNVWRYWRRVVLFLLLLSGALTLLALPVGLSYVILSAVSPTAGEFLMFVVQIALIWALVYLFFAIQALLLSDVGPVRAIRYSVLVISGNFWAAMGLIGLTFLITLGLPIAWQLAAGSAVGLVVGIVGNAYVGTGVAAAGFLFYKERLERLQAKSGAAATSTTKEAQ